MGTRFRALRQWWRNWSRIGSVVLSVALLAGSALPVAAQGDTEVTVGSLDTTFSQNKQNEPAVAINLINPLILAAGANDNIDMEACNAGDDTTCPFTAGVGVSGVQFSLNGGASWIQPTYTGYSARACLGVVGSDPGCTPNPQGPIGTLPWYYESNAVSNGDPALAFGPRPGPGGFSWANGARLYYANISTPFPDSNREEFFKGQGAIAVSRTDDVEAAAANVKGAWMPPVIATKQASALFSDKEAIWADNAASSRFFGNVYVCDVAFRSMGGAPEPVVVSRSTDGGETWTTRQISQAANTGSGAGRSGGRQGCSVRTDSTGVVYVFWSGTLGRQGVIDLARSFDGGRTFERGRPIANVEGCGVFDSVSGRFTFDGVAGARTDSFPSADIANGAPTGAGATNLIAVTWCDGPTPTNTNPGANEQALVTYSTTQGATWSMPANAAPAGDRPDFPAVAVSPDGTDVYLVYQNFLQPWQNSTLAPPRLQQGVVRHANFAGGVLGAFSDMHRAAIGDARGSSANALTAEFLGDYNYVAANNDFAVAVWNDVRNATDCPAIDSYRQFVAGGPAAPRPAPQQNCAPTFGNTDIFSSRITDPTP
jgi:hypothetical protein